MKLFSNKKVRGLVAIALATAFIGCAPVSKRLSAGGSDAFGKGVSSQGCYLFMLSELEKKQGNLDRAIVLMEKAVKADPRTSYLQYELAVLYLMQRDEDSALRVLKGLLKENPSDPDALMMFGRISQKEGRLAAALKAYQRVLAVDPSQADVYALLGKIYIDKGELSKALGVYKRLVKQHPGSYLGHFFIGKIYADQGKLDAAEKEFKATLSLAPDLEEPYYELLKIYDRKGEESKKLAVYKAILKENPDDLDAMMALGLYYHRQGAADKADAIFRELGRRSLQDRSVAAQLASSYFDREAYADAVVILKGMLESAPRSSDLNYLMGVAEDASGAKQAAIPYFKKVEADSAFFQNAVLHIAFVYQERKQASKAIEVLEDAVKRMPSSVDLHLYLGSFYEQMNQLNQAEATFKKGLTLDPDNVKLHFRLGVIYDKKGDQQASIREMKRVIKLDPSHADALNYLGYTYAQMGIKLDQAEKMVQKALEKDPNDGYITDSLGWIYYKKGQLKKAVATMQKAVSLVPDDPTILEHMGDVYLKAAEPAKALEFYRRSLKNQNKAKDQEPGAVKNIEEKIRSLTEKGK